MKSDAPQRDECKSSDLPRKRVYQAPAVRPLGAVAELTLNNGTTASFDVVTQQTGKTAGG